MERPTGVTILAVLTFLGAAFLALAAIIFLAGGAMLSQAMASGFGAIAGVGAAVIAVVFLVFAVLYVAVGMGMLKLQNWARIVTIILVGLGLLSAAAGVLLSFAHFRLFFLVRELIVLGIDIWIIAYLFRPHVKQAFGAS